MAIALQPERAPLLEGYGAQGAAVLEILIASDRVTCRFWMDPLSAEPQSEASVDATRATVKWLDRVLLQFVERTLRMA